jgi:hypothetical protein
MLKPHEQNAFLASGIKQILAVLLACLVVYAVTYALILLHPALAIVSFIGFFAIMIIVIVTQPNRL